MYLCIIIWLFYWRLEVRSSLIDRLIGSVSNIPQLGNKHRPLSPCERRVRAYAALLQVSGIIPYYLVTVAIRSLLLTRTDSLLSSSSPKRGGETITDTQTGNPARLLWIGQLWSWCACFWSFDTGFKSSIDFVEFEAYFVFYLVLLIFYVCHLSVILKL